MLTIVILLLALVAVVGMNGFEFYRGPIWFKWGGMKMRCLECGRELEFQDHLHPPVWKCPGCGATIPKD